MPDNALLGVQIAARQTGTCDNITWSIAASNDEYNLVNTPSDYYSGYGEVPCR